MTEIEELETLMPTARTVRAGGTDVPVLPIPMGRLPAFMRAVLPIAHIFALEEGEQLNYSALLVSGGEDLLEAVAVGAGLPREWIDRLDPADFVGLLEAVVEVNLDFFIQRLRPAMQRADKTLEAAMARLAQAGREPSRP